MIKGVTNSGKAAAGWQRQSRSLSRGDQGRTRSTRPDLQPESGPLAGLGFAGQEADVAVGMVAVGAAGAGADPDLQALQAGRHATVGIGPEGDAHTPEGGPSGAARGRTEPGVFLTLGGSPSGIGSTLQFALDLEGVAVAAKVGGRAKILPSLRNSETQTQPDQWPIPSLVNI